MRVKTFKIDRDARGITDGSVRVTAESHGESHGVVVRLTGRRLLTGEFAIATLTLSQEETAQIIDQLTAALQIGGSR